MERNGLPHRSREAKIGYWVMGICGFFLASFFITPLTMPAGTVPPLGARANAIDYASTSGFGSSGNTIYTTHTHEDGSVHDHETFVWRDLNAYAAFIYAFGDLNCHQKHERSWEVNNNQLAVCTRDIGFFFGLFLAGALFTRRGWNRWTVRDTCLSILPDSYLHSIYQKNRRTLMWIAFGCVLCLPLIADGFLQLLTPYESSNIKRVLTGTPFGFGLGLLLCSMFAARADAFTSAGGVLLPAQSSFVLAKPTNKGQSESE